ncbi:MAG: hypothetical protein M5R40_25350 [Anaerolineae bacterium]|nr:hypothetical protein [Anaerolineae bacterium]
MTIVVRPEDAAFADGVHSERPIDEIWTVSRNEFGWLTKSTDTETVRDEVWARWDPRLPELGCYEISIFVPDFDVPLTHRARYKVHSVKGQAGEYLIEVDQAQYRDQWVSLGGL